MIRKSVFAKNSFKICLFIEENTKNIINLSVLLTMPPPEINFHLSHSGMFRICLPVPCKVGPDVPRIIPASLELISIHRADTRKDAPRRRLICALLYSQATIQFEAVVRTSQKVAAILIVDNV